MALATRCPACATIFRISTAQAAAKGGMVRCGQCRNVFNSLDALVRVEDLDIVDEAAVEVEHEPAAFAASPTLRVPASAFDDPSLDDASHEASREASDSGFRDSEVSGVLASLSAPTEDHSTTHEWWMPDPAGRREPSATPRPPTSLHDPSPTAAISRASMAGDGAIADPPFGDAPPATVQSEPATPTAWAGPDDGTGPVFMQPPRYAEPASRAARWTWGTLSFFALLLLLGQGVYLERDELAARWSPCKPWLVAACTKLGCKVDYPTRLDSITIESATIQTPAPEADLYVLNALLRNRDTIDVRYPYLELVLTDLEDRPVLRRVLRPEDYATLAPDGRTLASPGFAAQSELPVRLTFELNDLKFAGYRLDRFYP